VTASWSEASTATAHGIKLGRELDVLAELLGLDGS
jgi:hypothetical protein